MFAIMLTADVALAQGTEKEYWRRKASFRELAKRFDTSLLFSNCGHNPPVLLRADGTIERLTATATVLGLFEK
jgi:hypothetical protein